MLLLIDLEKIRTDSFILLLLFFFSAISLLKELQNESIPGEWRSDKFHSLHDYLINEGKLKTFLILLNSLSVYILYTSKKGPIQRQNIESRGRNNRSRHFDLNHALYCVAIVDKK
jgi:hypothetical protein